MQEIAKQQPCKQVDKVELIAIFKAPYQPIDPAIQQTQLNSSISHRQTVQMEANHSNKSIPLTFSKPNKSRRPSIRCKEKQNKDSTKQISSDSKIKFKDMPPKRKRNYSKFCDELPSFINHEKENQYEDRVIVKNRFLEESNIGIDNFIILKKLGEGSFGQVFKAIQKQTNTLFALKIMNKQGLKQMNLIERLASELKIQQYCNHVNIVKLYGVFQDQRSIFLVQQYAGERTLYSLMEDKKQAKFIQKESQSIIRQICNAVLYLHANNIIHRDIKPENILIAPGGLVKLTDFGWSVYNPDKSLRETICGTPLYLSPELITAQKYNESVDIWAIGILAYELLTGEMPFGIRCIRDLHNIITQDVDFTKVSNPQAKNFISILLTKQILLRKNMSEICQHQFLGNSVGVNYD